MVIRSCHGPHRSQPSSTVKPGPSGCRISSGASVRAAGKLAASYRQGAAGTGTMSPSCSSTISDVSMSQMASRFSTGFAYGLLPGPSSR